MFGEVGSSAYLDSMTSPEESQAAPGPAERPDAYRELFERSADAILIIEGETFIDCNQATVEMLRYTSRE